MFHASRPEWTGKVAHAFSDADIKESQMQLTHLVNALNLLLSTCKLPSVAEQDKILQREQNADLLSLVEDDSTIVQGEEDSFTMNRRMSMLSENVANEHESSMSRIDQELFQSQAYQRALIYSPKQLWVRGTNEASMNLLRAIVSHNAPIVLSL